MYTVTPTSRSMGHNWLGPLPYEDRRWISRSRTPRRSRRFRREVRAWLEANVPPGITRTPVDRADSLTALPGAARPSAASSAPRAGSIRARPRPTAAAGSTSTTPSSSKKKSIASSSSLPPYYDSGGRLGSATILVWGTEEQKQAFLPPIYRGRGPHLAAPDRARRRLRPGRRDHDAAIRDGDEYVLNGQKIFVGSDHGADRIWMIACTSPERPRHENLSLVHDRRQPAGHHRAAHGADGHRRRGRHRPRAEEHRLLRRRARAGIRAGRRREQRLEGGEHAPRARARRRRPHRPQPRVGSPAALLPGDQARRRAAHAARRHARPARRHLHQDRGPAALRPAQLLADLRASGRAPTRARSSRTTAR